MSRFGDGRNRRAGARWALIIGRPDLRVALQGAVELQVQKIVNGLDSRVQARGSDSQPTRESADGQGGDAALVQKGDLLPGPSHRQRRRRHGVPVWGQPSNSSTLGTVSTIIVRLIACLIYPFCRCRMTPCGSGL